VNTLLIVLCALAMLIGIIGVVVPVLPGLLPCLAAVLAWAVFGEGDSTTRWVVFGVSTVWVVVGTVVKFAWPGQQMKAIGVPTRSLVAGILLGVVLMFPIPVVGLFIGFILGVWAAEAARLGGFAPAWPSTIAAIRAAGLSVLIELGAACLVAVTWVVGVLVA
jgi:hypothetical protein